MPQPSNLAGWGTTPIKSITPPIQKPSDEGGKYKALFDSIYRIVYPTTEQQIDQQTRLEWENIEGEVMLEVLKADIISGVPFTEVTHPFFKFASRQDCLDRMVTDGFVEKLSKRHLLPSMFVMKQKLNELLVSLKAGGRTDLVQIFQAFSMSMQEHEHTDPLRPRMGGRLS